jgi:DNA-binding HxlR family transcriptional regulator
MGTKDTEAFCAVALTVEMIGGKWKGPILFYLLRDGTLRFGELRSRLPRVTQRMLTLQLRELEHDGLVTRIVHPVVPPHVDYTLTSWGKSLETVIVGMADWGRRHRTRCERTIEERESVA